jgi:glycosyltransferase involved in cell wall biosynthesis
MHLPISVFIIAKNEADRIGTTINSVKNWVDEVLVIDSGSTDDTVSVATFLGARVLYNEWEGYGPQKRFAEDECKNKWLLNLDADEEATEELAQEIKDLFASGEPPLSGYIIKVRDMLPGEKKFAPLAHTNHCLRLYNMEKGRFSESPVHDSVIMQEGETVGKLKSLIRHRSFRSISHTIEKMNSYTTAQAENLIAGRGLMFPRIRLVFEVPASFFKAYFLRLYILRGTRGIIYSKLYAFGRVMRVAKYLEMKANKTD